ncbi:MAG: KpsF/GutQ family sugar-phosphate isomerase [Arenicella sp.]
MKQHDFIGSAQTVLNLEAQSVETLLERLDQHFIAACELIMACHGRVIVVGIGKSGHIGNKIAATLASTGTPSFFVHPSEASHGDLGMITPKDLVIAISNSGETPEILTILPIIKRMGVKLVSLSGKQNSSIAQQADVNIDVGVSKEACPLNLAPTASTTATLAMGDALAIAILEARNFSEQDFARSHPGGALGRRLLLYVEDIMHKGSQIPLVDETASIDQTLLEMSQKSLGMTGITDQNKQLTGVFTDGDLRRALSQHNNINACKIGDIMTKDPMTVAPDLLAAELVPIMQSRAINGVFVLDNTNTIVGAISMHDLLRAGVL